MYGQNLGVRPDAPIEPISTKFCVLVRVLDTFLSFEFQKDRKKNVGAVGVEISLLPLKRHVAYTTACCYFTSRNSVIMGEKNFFSNFLESASEFCYVIP